MTDKKQMNRRDFIQNVSTGAAGIAFASALSTLTAASPASAQKPDYYDKMDMSKLGNVVREPNVVEFDADAEMLLGDKVRKVNYSCYFFIPKGTPHCPLVIKRVGKPIIFIDARISE